VPGSRSAALSAERIRRVSTGRTARRAGAGAGEESHAWQPMSRAEFADLERGQRLRDRQGRVWTITAEPYHEHGLAHVVLRSGDLVRRISERHADDYSLLRDAR
jgi:hypothetical protein